MYVCVCVCVCICMYVFELQQEIGKNSLFRLTIVGPGAKIEAESASVSESLGAHAGLKSESEIKSESVITFQPGMGVASKPGIGINEECKGESDSFLTKDKNAADALLGDKSSVQSSTYMHHLQTNCVIANQHMYLCAELYLSNVLLY